MDWYVLEGKTPVKAKSLLEGSLAFEKLDRKVAKTQVSKDVEVSTVFLGLDHQFGLGPPLLFETMVFGGEHHGDMDRYTTWEEAEEGHKRMVKELRKQELKIVNGGKE